MQIDTGSSKIISAVTEPSYSLHKIIAVLVVFSQIFISVTGSVVRVTQSGLGCPTWPQCFPGSFVPVKDGHTALFHQIIEFTNRQLAVWLVTVLSILIVIVSYRRHSSKKIITLSWIIPCGTIAQAIVGGITVLCGLLWWTVALHLLASLLMVWFAMCLYISICDISLPVSLSERDVQGLRDHHNYSTVYIAAIIATIAAGLTAIAGTLVTGAGPLAGDLSPEHRVVRLSIKIKYLLIAHTGAAIILVFAVLYLAFILNKYRNTARFKTPTRMVLLILGAQICIGIAQTVFKLPPVLVVLHVLGACLIIANLALIYTRVKESL